MANTSRPRLAQAVLAFARRGEYDAILTDGEHIGIPLALLLKVVGSRIARTLTKALRADAQLHFLSFFCRAASCCVCRRANAARCFADWCVRK